MNRFFKKNFVNPIYFMMSNIFVFEFTRSFIFGFRMMECCISKRHIPVLNKYYKTKAKQIIFKKNDLEILFIT